MPKISVIMGIYNSNKRDMVLLSINSILKQSFEDFEFIICDDGSTDGTFQLISKLSESDSRIRIIRNEKNMGLAYSLNHCLKESKGEYIARMDADDYSRPDRLKRQVEFLEQHSEYVMVGSWADLFDDSGIWGQKKVPEKPGKEDFLFTSPFIHACIMIRNNAIKELNGYCVSKETLRAEDYDLWMRIYARGYRGYNFQNSLFCVREDNDTFRRRSYKFRFDEAKIRYKGFKSLGLLPKGIPYVIKPLIVGLIPQKILVKLRNHRI